MGLTSLTHQYYKLISVTSQRVTRICAESGTDKESLRGLILEVIGENNRRGIAPPPQV